MRKFLFWVSAALLLPSLAVAQRAPAPSEELNTLLMHTTFLIYGTSAAEAGKVSFGTAFVMALPRPNDPKLGDIVLVTAAHVLNGISGNTAHLLVRRENSDGSYSKFDCDIAIRDAGQSRYVQHPTADVAAMYADLPDEVPMTGLTPNFLATDETLKLIELHPGDEAFVLGFPLAVTGPGGFPILRTARLASYPLVPMTVAGKFYADLFLYPGNSGGPVYYVFANRVYGASVHIGVVQGILGLVVEQEFSPLPEFADKPMNLAAIVPAAFIQQTLDLLPKKN